MTRRRLPHAARLAFTRGFVGAVVTGVVVGAAIAGGAGGCGLVGAMAYKLSPPVKNPPQHELGSGPVVVVVERPTRAPGASLDAQRIGRYVTAILREHKPGAILDPEALTAFDAPAPRGSAWSAAIRPTPTRPALPDTRPTTLLGKARAIGARQLISVQLTRFTVEFTMATEMVKGRAEASVRVVDADTGQTLWPTDTTQGRPVSFATRYTPGQSPREESVIRDEMALGMADRIARLFFEWSTDQVDAGSPLLDH